MTKNNYALFPSKKIQPYDGMSITASVWGEAHGYHARLQNAHQVFLHGAGIVTGLDVVASDPADSVVFILPGVAVDSIGQMIVLPEPVAYDLGRKMEGKLHLLLLHREVKSPTGRDEENNAAAYMQDEYVIIARPDVPDMPSVELARIDRTDPNAAIHDALDASAPLPDSIDLRFRQSVCPPPAEQVLAGVCCLDDAAPGCASGLANLAKSLQASSPYRLIVEDHRPLDKSIFECRLVYLVAGKSSRLSKEQAEIVSTYLENGGRLLVEFGEPVNEQDAQRLLKPAGVKLDKLDASHPAFQSPHMFFSPPAGSQSGESPAVWSWGASVLCTGAGYGALWSGRADPSLLTRTAVRDALEWGANLLTYLLSRP